MGGGTRAASTLYGSKRKVAVSLKAINRTGKRYGVDLRLHEKTPPRIKVFSEAQWEAQFDKEEAAAFYRKWEETIYIRRKYFAGRALQGVMTHELGHHFSGDRKYFKGLGRDFEEGMVEYLTQGSRALGYLGRGTRFTGGYKTYYKEVADIETLMGVVGRRKLLRVWRDGIDASHKTPKVKRLRKAVDQAEKDRSRLSNLYETKIQERYDKYLTDKRKVGGGWNPTAAQKEKKAKLQASVDRAIDKLRLDRSVAISKLKIGHKLSAYDKAKDESRGYTVIANALEKKGYKGTAEFFKRSYKQGRNSRSVNNIREIMREDEAKYNLDRALRVPPENLKSVRTGEIIE